MTENAQRIAIADPRFCDRKSRMALALGYEFDPIHGPVHQVWLKKEPFERHTHDWFDRYFSDLNAMHEAEKVLTLEQREDYVTSLNENFNTNSPNTVWWTNAHATATQRAEAFLRTLNLWTE